MAVFSMTPLAVHALLSDPAHAMPPKQARIAQNTPIPPEYRSSWCKILRTGGAYLDQTHLFAQGMSIGVR